MTVAELGERMSAGEFAEWREFAADEPFGSQREDERAGVVAAIIANAFGGSKRRKAFTPADFFPELAGPEPPPVSMRQKVRAVLTAAAGNRKPPRRTRGKP